MGDVYICDAVRTPIGRFGGSLAKVRADDLGAAPIKALMARHPKLDWSQVDEVYFGCANQAGEDNRNVARMALLLAGMPELGSRPDPQPPLRLGARCGRRSGPRDPRRRNRFRHCRRRRVDDAGAVRDGQGAGSVFALGRNFRHHDRLALHQSPDEGAVRRRCDARDRRERRRGDQVSRADQDAFAIRSQQRAGAAIASGYFAEEITPITIPAARPAPSRSTRTSIRAPKPRWKA